jgi:hypothetical protein
MKFFKSKFTNDNVSQNIALAVDIVANYSAIFRKSDTGLFFYSPGKMRYVDFDQSHEGFIRSLNEI